MALKDPIAIRFDEKTLNDLAALSDDSNIPVATLIRMTVQKHLPKIRRLLVG